MASPVALRNLVISPNLTMILMTGLIRFTASCISSMTHHMLFAPNTPLQLLPRRSHLMEEIPPSPLAYNNVPRSDAARLANAHIDLVRVWHGNLQCPCNMSDKDYKSFVRYYMEFYLVHDQLWQNDPQSCHKLVVPTHCHLFILTSAYNDIGHKGFYTTGTLIIECFWWPHLADDISCCHICQLRQTQKLLILPTVAMPAPILTKVYMHMPPAGAFKYIVSRCSLMHYPKFRMLRRETASAIGDWIFQDLICCWGTLVEIVTNNGMPLQ
ncbi:hypothetical protein K438DRAFT_833385 [Mycena galopus ATCC 62051]|nr:hypothetical protein K438DRAFT_833385 [Mycena galopus ATCC 62051]